MPVYFRIKDCEEGPVLTVDPEDAIGILGSMAASVLESDNEEAYMFEAVEMTEQEFESLPEFTGF